MNSCLVLQTPVQVYAQGEGVASEAGQLGRWTLMGYEEWHRFCRDVQMSDSVCTMKQITLSFVWSRMCVAGSETIDAVRVKFMHLHFEDFLEVPRHRMGHLRLQQASRPHAPNVFDTGSCPFSDYEVVTF